MKKYDEIMSKIEMDDEMKKRILSYTEHLNLQKEKASSDSSSPKVRRIRRKIRNSVAAMAACAAVFLVCMSMWNTSKQQPDQSGELVGITNEITEVDSLKALADAVNFPVSEAAGLPFETEKETYTSYWGEVAQIEYVGENWTAVFRKGKGTEDVSGDYNEYPQVKEVTAGPYTAVLKGENDVFSLAVWTDGEYSYSLTVEPGMNEEEWETVIEKTGENSEK